MQQQKESALAIAEEIANKYNIPKEEINEILYKHGVHKAFFTRKYFLKLMHKYEKVRKELLEENKLALDNLRKNHKGTNSGDVDILQMTQKLQKVRGKLNSFIEISKDFRKIRSYESAIDKNLDTH